MKGKLIVIDGADGSGKATQTDLLIKKLEEKGKEVKKIDFPQYGKPSASFVENYLNGKYGGADEVDPKVASLFYALDRFDGKDVVLKDLEDGKIIISNRYVSSNAGHQGGKIKNKDERDKYLDWLYDLEYNILGLPKPDLNIYLHVPWEIGQKLVDKKGERDYVGGKKRDIHEDDDNHLKNAQESYEYLVNREPNWVKIDCVKDSELMSREEIHGIIWDRISKSL